jgi:four helix bundle protein
MEEFRFQNLDIWKRSSNLALQLFTVCDHLEHERLHRFAEQLRAASLSIPNNIALRPVGA